VTTRTEQQKAYEERYAALVGLRLAGVTYYELDCGVDQPTWPLYRNVGHWLDWGLDLHSLDSSTLSLGWSSEFVQFDMALFEGPYKKLFAADANVVARDVSEEREWLPYLDQEIRSVEIYWSRTDLRSSNGERRESVHPQDVVLHFDALAPVYVGARQYSDEADELWLMTNNVFVVFSDDVARRYRVGPYDEHLRSFGKITGHALMPDTPSTYNLEPRTSPASIIVNSPRTQSMSFQKQLVRKAGRAVHDYRMIREGDRIAVGVSGGKDSLALLDALLHLQRRSPVRFELQAFTVEQGKFVRPVDPLGDYMKDRGVEWTYYRDEASFDLIEQQPDHGCDLCSRYRRRAVYQIASELGANVVALGHTADDVAEALLRNTLYTGKLASLPPVTTSRSGDFRLIRPIILVSEEVTSGYAAEKGIPITPCVCSFKTGTVRESIRTFLASARAENPHVLENMLSAMGNVDENRLLDRRFLDLGPDTDLPPSPPVLPPILAEETI